MASHCYAPNSLKDRVQKLDKIGTPEHLPNDTPDTTLESQTLTVYSPLVGVPITNPGISFSNILFVCNGGTSGDEIDS